MARMSKLNPKMLLWRFVTFLSIFYMIELYLTHPLYTVFMHFNSTIYFLFVSLFIAVYNLFNSLFSELGVRQFFNVATTSDNYTDNAHNEPVAVK